MIDVGFHLGIFFDNHSDGKRGFRRFGRRNPEADAQSVNSAPQLRPLVHVHGQGGVGRRSPPSDRLAFKKRWFGNEPRHPAGVARSFPTANPCRAKSCYDAALLSRMRPQPDRSRRHPAKLAFDGNHNNHLVEADGQIAFSCFHPSFVSTTAALASRLSAVLRARSGKAAFTFAFFAQAGKSAR